MREICCFSSTRVARRAGFLHHGVGDGNPVFSFLGGRLRRGRRRLPGEHGADGRHPQQHHERHHEPGTRCHSDLTGFFVAHHFTFAMTRSVVVNSESVADSSSSYGPGVVKEALVRAADGFENETGAGPFNIRQVVTRILAARQAFIGDATKKMQFLGRRGVDRDLALARGLSQQADGRRAVQAHAARGLRIVDPPELSGAFEQVPVRLQHPLARPRRRAGIGQRPAHLAVEIRADHHHALEAPVPRLEHRRLLPVARNGRKAVTGARRYGAPVRRCG